MSSTGVLCTVRTAREERVRFTKLLHFKIYFFYIDFSSRYVKKKPILPHTSEDTQLELPSSNLFN